MLSKPTTSGKSAQLTSSVPVSMTDEQRFFFDLKGWILLPAVLSDEEIEGMKAEIYADGRQENRLEESISVPKGFQGRLQELLDHPSIVGILNEILTEPPFVGDEYYGFRCENSFITVREPGWKTNEGTGTPHVVRPPQQANAMRYQVQGNKIFSGLTRVVWELEEVRTGRGGTTFLSGSHKAHFNYGGPDPYRPNISESPWAESLTDAMENYSCPAGSAVIFTESLVHASNDWDNPDNPRCAVFNCYNSIWAQWHRLNVPHELIEMMPPRRQTLFRGTWLLSNEGTNETYSADNRSL